jgi:hypothetical protein
MPKTKFFLAAACLLGTVVSTKAATFLPTSPLIQIGDDTDIFFTGSVSFDFKDNLFSVAEKKSAALLTFTPGFELEYAKDSPVAFFLRANRSFLQYNQSEFKDLEEGQDNITGSLNYNPGGPLQVTISSSYNESARNDQLANILGANAAVLGATLVRQANYNHLLGVSYKLTEKINLDISFINSYNHYLNPVKTQTDVLNTLSGDTIRNINYNTNTLSEINTKSIPISITYRTPSEKLTYGFNYKHDVSDFSAAPYFSTSQKILPLPVGSVITNTRPPGQRQFTQDFFGLTINGEPTSSGKIHITTRFGYFTSDLDGATNNGASYDLRISHNLTEKFTHELSLGNNTSASVAGGSIKTESIAYSIAYALSEKILLNFNAAKSKSTTGNTQIDALNLSAGASWEYNKYLRFGAVVDTLDSKVKNTPSSNFKANSLKLSSTFRY